MQKLFYAKRISVPGSALHSYVLGVTHYNNCKIYAFGAGKGDFCRCSRAHFCSVSHNKTGTCASGGVLAFDPPLLSLKCVPLIKGAGIVGFPVSSNELGLEQGVVSLQTTSRRPVVGNLFRIFSSIPDIFPFTSCAWVTLPKVQIYL